MDYNINFPNLGIYLDHVGKSISIGNFSIAFYGMIIAAGMFLGLFAAMKRAKETGQDPNTYQDLFIFLIVFGVIGARLYYVIFAWDKYSGDLLSIFNLRQGGLAIYGGIIGGVITAVIFCRIKKKNLLQVLDTIVMSVLIGQILGRWGNFFNREAFGDYTNSIFAMQLPTSAVRSSEITSNMLKHLTTINGVEYIQVHPTFLYESLWNLGLLILIFLIRNKTKYHGELMLIYFLGYGIGRMWIESLRTDQLLIPGIEFPVSIALSAVLAAASATLLVLNRKKPSA